MQYNTFHYLIDKTPKNIDEKHILTKYLCFLSIINKEITIKVKLS